MNRIWLSDKIYNFICNAGLKNSFHRIYKDSNGTEFIRILGQRINVADYERQDFDVNSALGLKFI